MLSGVLDHLPESVDTHVLGFPCHVTNGGDKRACKCSDICVLSKGFLLLCNILALSQNNAALWSGAM